MDLRTRNADMAPGNVFCIRVVCKVASTFEVKSPRASTGYTAIIWSVSSCITCWYTENWVPLLRRAVAGSREKGKPPVIQRRDLRPAMPLVLCAICWKAVKVLSAAAAEINVA